MGGDSQPGMGQLCQGSPGARAKQTRCRATLKTTNTLFLLPAVPPLWQGVPQQYTHRAVGGQRLSPAARGPICVVLPFVAGGAQALCLQQLPDHLAAGPD